MFPPSCITARTMTVPFPLPLFEYIGQSDGNARQQECQSDFEQEATEETEKPSLFPQSSPWTHSKLAPGRINLDTPSVNLRTLKLSNDHDCLSLDDVAP